MSALVSNEEKNRRYVRPVDNFKRLAKDDRIYYFINVTDDETEQSYLGTYAGTMYKREHATDLVQPNIIRGCIMYSRERLEGNAETPKMVKTRNFLRGVVMQLDNFQGLFQIPSYEKMVPEKFTTKEGTWKMGRKLPFRKEN